MDKMHAASYYLFHPAAQNMSNTQILQSGAEVEQGATKSKSLTHCSE